MNSNNYLNFFLKCFCKSIIWRRRFQLSTWQRTISIHLTWTLKWSLKDGPQGYKMFREKQDNCVRVVFDPTRMWWRPSAPKKCLVKINILQGIFRSAVRRKSSFQFHVFIQDLNTHNNSFFFFYQPISPDTGLVSSLKYSCRCWSFLWQRRCMVSSPATEAEPRRVTADATVVGQKTQQRLYS